MIFGNLILDALLVIFLALGFWYGWQRGFLRIVLKTFAGLFSAVIAMTFFDDLGATLKEKYVFDFVKGKVSGSLAELGAGVDADTIVDKVPEGLQNAASIVGIDLAAMAENAAAETTVTAAKVVSMIRFVFILVYLLTQFYTTAIGNIKA